MATEDPTELYLARHGETEWSLSGQHTGTTDIPLTPDGEDQARALGGRLAGISFDRVLSSPRLRAKQTADLAGFGDRVEVVEDAAEWNYGDYEGLTTDQIHAKNPGWVIYRDGAPGGESPQQVSDRADRLIERLKAEPGRTLLFCHGHFSRILAVRWVKLPVAQGGIFVLGTAALNVLGFDSHQDRAAIRLWNDTLHIKKDG